MHEKRTYGFKPCGLRGFCLGSVGSYGTLAEGGTGVGDQRAVIYRTLKNAVSIDEEHTDPFEHDVGY